MSVGKKIKQLRELRNFTQAYMAEKLNLSLGGYGKIERDETDITLNRLNRIAEILETDIMTVMGFDPKQVFHQYNNKIANASGTVQNQQFIAEDEIKNEITQMKNRIDSLISRMDEIEKGISHKSKN